MHRRRDRLVRIAALCGTLAVLAALPTPGAGAVARPATHPLTGTESGAGHTVTWTIGGAYPVPANRPDLLAYPYDGVIYPGSVVTLSGSETFTLGAGLVTNLDMTASLGFMMDAKDTATLRKTVSAGTYTMPFNLKLKVPRSRSAAETVAAPAAPLNTVQAMVDSRNCNDDGACDGPEVIMYLALLPGKAPKGDRIAPTVRAVPTRNIITLGHQIPAGYRAYDSDGPVKVHADLYSGGDLVGSQSTPGFVRSGHEGILRFPAGASGNGPFYYCLWAEDKAGNHSPGEPASDCAWLSREVPLVNVSNGCGTAAWGSGPEWLQNALGDTRTYGTTTVQIRPACNVHDAAYLGATVYNEFTKRVEDFRTTSRKQADHEFLDNIRDICAKALRGAKNKDELTTCKNGVGLKGLGALAAGPGGIAAAFPVIGGMSYFEGVRAFGGVGYDWDATTTGTQQSKPATTEPRGGGRNGS
jgi:hypothetical protein